MAITCSISQSILKSENCGYSLPQIVDVYLIDYNSVTVGKTDQPDGQDEISGVTPATGASFYHIEPVKDSTNFSDTLSSGSSGNKYRTVTVEFSVNQTYNKSMHAFIDGISLGRYFAVVKTAEGNYIGLGRQTGVEASAADLQGGTDNNGITVTLTCNQAESSMNLTDAAVEQLLQNLAD